MDPDEITAYLLRRPQWSASRSSGPGGQHRDKASTRAELSLERRQPGGFWTPILPPGWRGPSAWRLARCASPSRTSAHWRATRRSPPSGCAPAWPRHWHRRHRRAARHARVALPAASGSKPRRAAARSSSCAARRRTRPAEPISRTLADAPEPRVPSVDVMAASSVIDTLADSVVGMRLAHPIRVGLRWAFGRGQDDTRGCRRGCASQTAEGCSPHIARRFPASWPQVPIRTWRVDSALVLRVLRLSRVRDLLLRPLGPSGGVGVARLFGIPLEMCRWRRSGSKSPRRRFWWSPAL